MLVKHSHFFCEKCKSILDINEINLNDVVNEIEINNNIKILSNQISLYGICSKCQEKK
jgi:Fe2+ or Zn2+ uptake regulation protein